MRRKRSYIDHPGGVTRRGTFDPQGEWCRTDRYPEFQKTLARIRPDLHLGWDRSNGRWCLIREDRVQRYGLWDGVRIGYLATVHTLAYDICWKVARNPGPGSVKHYRAPSESILADVARSHRKRFEFDNSDWASDQITELGLKREAEQNAEVQKDLDETWEEAAWHFDASSSTPAVKIRASVPANYEASKT